MRTSMRYSALNPSTGSLASEFQPPGVLSVWPACPSISPSAVITSSLAAAVAVGAVETVPASWFAPGAKFPVTSSGFTVATLRHSVI